jgi:hypothetical protein
MTDFRALCAAIVSASDAVEHDASAAEGDFLAAVDNARAALAQAEPVAAEEPMIPSRYRGWQVNVYRDGFHAGYKEALVRSANAAPA